MKTITFIRFAAVTTLLLSTTAYIFSQTVPQGINYQAVARNTNGDPLAGKNISVRISIISGTMPPYSTDYSETHAVTTNPFGLFTLQIGQGTVISGNFISIPWKNGNRWLKVDMDPDGGSNYTTIGTNELLSVPYAMYSAGAGQADGNWSLDGNTGIGSSQFIGTTDSKDVLLKTNSLERIRITAGGRIGIGNVYPSNRLTVFDSLGTGNSFHHIMDVRSLFSSGPAYAGVALGYMANGSVATGGLINSHNALPLFLGTSNKPQTISLTDNGRVGIGTTTPTYTLHVNGGNDQVALITEGSNSSYASFYIKALTSGAIAGVGYLTEGYLKAGHWVNGSGDWFLRTGNSLTTRLTVLGTGNIGIGTVTPVSALDVNGTVTISGGPNSEINRTTSGSANLVPIAYGSIGNTGNIYSGTGNFTVSKTGTGVYSITITGESYTSQGYAALAVVHGSAGAGIASVSNDLSGNLLIYTYQLSGTAVDRNFSFTVFKP